MGWFLDLSSISALWVYFFVINRQNKKQTLKKKKKDMMKSCPGFDACIGPRFCQCDFSAWIDGRMQSVS